MQKFCDTHLSSMLKILNRMLRRLCSRLRPPIRRRPKPIIVIQKLEKTSSKTQPDGSATVHPNAPVNSANSEKPIRIATFNAALFSMAPAVPKTENSPGFEYGNEDYTKTKKTIDQNLRSKSENDRPKSILKQPPLHSSSMNGSESLSKRQRFAKSKLRVSINLPDNEISLNRSGQLRFIENKKEDPSSSSSSTTSRILKGKAPLRSTAGSSSSRANGRDGQSYRSSRRTVVEVLKEVNVDILGLQDVRAEEEKGMKPLSDLADVLGMNYVFAESWAPEFGNAILSKWPIKRWKVEKILDHSDFRNVLKATIEIPWAGEVNFHCTHLDHLDENWRMKQINAIIQSSHGPHILAGDLNSLDQTDYSSERWTDIVKYYEEMGKPTPKVEVMKFLKSKWFTDAKDFAGECESVVVIAKGQGVQGTCKYGTRIDYILASPDSPFKFVPGSYSVCSSKGTSDHHIVKVDIFKEDRNAQNTKLQQLKQRVVKITNSSSSSKGIWKL